MWHPAAKLKELKKTEGKTLYIENHKIALFRIGSKCYALQDACIHRGGPLGEGNLEGDCVTCPWHAWEFNVKTGECKTMPGAKQKTYPIKIENGQILIDL